MSTTETYQGWKNHETWCVNLWLTNNQGDYDYWRENAAECKAEAADPHTRNEYWTEEEHAKFTLADRIKNCIESANPLTEQASMWSDLLESAIGNVDWQEIAESFLAE